MNRPIDIALKRRLALISQQGGFDPIYQGLLDYCNANTISIPTMDEQIKQNSIAVYFRSIGLLDKLVIFYYCKNAVGLEEISKLNWMSPGDFTLTQANPLLVPDFVPMQGFKHNSDNKYFDTLFNFSTDSPDISRLNVSHFYKLFDFPTTFTTANAISGCRIAAFNNEINFRNNSGTEMLVRFLEGSGGGASITQSQINDYYLADRNSTNYLVYKYDQVIDTNGLGGQLFPNQTMHFLGTNLNGTPNAVGIGGISVFGIAQSIRSEWGNAVAKLKEVEFADIDIIAELGQSNMEGRDGDTSNPDYPFTSDNGYYFDGNQEPINTLRGGATLGSQANYFCEEYYALTNRKAAVIEVAQGGTGLTSTASATNWSGSSSLRGNAESMISSALSFYGKAQPKAALWCQGERDAQEMASNGAYTISIVKAAMQDVIDWWQTEYPDVPFLISELGAPDNGVDIDHWEDMRDIQNEIASENTGVYIAFNGAKDFPSEGKMKDNLHYDYVGLSEMGVAFANFLSTL